VTDADLKRQAKLLVSVATMLGHYSDNLIRELSRATDEPTQQRIARVSAQRHRLQHAALLINQARALVIECRATTEETTA
jgi:hypothetical protein